MNNWRFWTMGIAALFLIELGIYIGRRTLGEEEILQQASIIMSGSKELLKLHWLGIETWQFPIDAWMIQEIISEQRPDYIVETGTYRGGSAALWCTILRQVNPGGIIITIDLISYPGREQIPPDLLSHIQFISGDSVDPQIVEKVRKTIQGKKTLVILDATHRKEHVLKELQSYAPMLHTGEYLIVQDTIIKPHGPLEAIQEFLKTSDQFKPDPYRERFGMTLYPQGYLKKIK